jgi:NADH:ubiquinone oxidoreductase subunit B-like Fe-S oxidoreductase
MGLRMEESVYGRMVGLRKRDNIRRLQFKKKRTVTSKLLDSLLHVRDEDLTVQPVFPNCVVEISQQVGRYHDINRYVQAPDASPEVQLPAQTIT